MATVNANNSTGNVVASTLVRDVDTKLFLYDANLTPLLAFQENIGNKRVVTNPKYEHYSKDHIALQTQINNGGGYNSSATSIVVDDGSIFNANDVVMCLTSGEHMLVTAVSTNTLTVTRGFGETSAASIADNEYVLKLSSSFAEGATSPNPLWLQESENYNYTQIFKEAVGITGTADATNFYLGNEYERRTREAMREWKRKMEMAALFGERYATGTTGNQPQRTTRGLNASITTNRFAIGGTMTQDYFVQSVLPSAMRYGSNTKLMLCSANMIKCFSDWGLDKLQTRTSDKMLGFEAKEYISGFGKLLIVYHPLLVDGLSGYSFIVDPENSRRVTLKGRDLKFEPDIQANDYDGRKGQFIAEIGFEHPLEKTHAVLTGLTGPG